MPDDAFVDATVAMIATWHGVAPPNAAALRMVADLRKIIADFEAQRGRLQFEDEPSSFEAALLDTALLDTAMLDTALLDTAMPDPMP